MKRLIINKFLQTVLIGSVFAFSAFSGGLSLSSSCTSIYNCVNNGVSGATGSTPSNSNPTIQSGISGVAKTGVNIFSIVVGAISVLMIIYGGFKYITSGGSSEKVTGAKNTLIYAIIGLVIVALAQLIVQWVLGTSNNIATTPAGLLSLFR